MGDELRNYKAFLKQIEKNPFDEGLRKVFADWLEEHDEVEEADEQRNWSRKKYEAEEFLQELATRLRMSYKELISIGDELAKGSYCFGDTEASYEMQNSWDEFRHHWGVLKGKPVVEDISEDQTHFRCAC